MNYFTCFQEKACCYKATSLNFGLISEVPQSPRITSQLLHHNSNVMRLLWTGMLGPLSPKVACIEYAHTID